MNDGEENWVWNVDMEVNLFHAMRGHKPVGVNRHFQMMCIHEKLSQSSAQKFTSNQIWKHLNTMYDLQALNESEILSFPNKETDFTLSDEEYAVWMNKTFPRTPADIIAESEAKRLEKEAAQKAREKEIREKEKEKEKQAKEKETKEKEAREKEAKEKEAKEKEMREKEAREKEKEAKEKEKEKEAKEKEKEMKEKDKEAKKGDKKTINKIMIDLCSANTPENSPKRKRTRKTSHTASPATETPPTKRRR